MTGRIVWLASYPKSGNTWLRAVYTALRRAGEPDINALQAEIVAMRSVFDAALGVRGSDLTHEEVQTLRPRADEALAEQLTESHWHKTHDSLLPGPTGEPVISVRATRAALYMVRDPRDVVVSWAHHAGRSIEWAVRSLERDLTVVNSTRLCSDQLPQRLGTWSKHVLSWVDQKDFPVHVLRYEDCLADPLGSFGMAFAAGGFEVSDQQLREAIAVTSWARLRAQEESKEFKERPSSEMFFRRGLAGAWVDELPAPLARQLEHDHAEVMARFGYLP